MRRRRRCWPRRIRRELAQELAESTGARLTLTDDPAEGVKGVDFIYTDVWVSMGEPHEVWAERIELLMPYQVNRELLEVTGNPAREVHALPAGLPRPRHQGRRGDLPEVRHPDAWR